MHAMDAKKILKGQYVGIEAVQTITVSHLQPIKTLFDILFSKLGTFLAEQKR